MTGMPVAPVDVVPSPLLSAPGAVAAEGLDAGVAAHYGDPLREQRLLEEGLAVVDLSNRAVLTVAGPDRLSWLHSMTTQSLTDLTPRSSVESLVLSPKGHVEHALHIVDSPGWTRCGSCSGWRWPTCPPTTPFSVSHTPPSRRQGSRWPGGTPGRTSSATLSLTGRSMAIPVRRGPGAR